MSERPATTVWRSRLRWRLTGAWQWPTFAVLVVVDAVVLARLPFSGGRANLLGALLAAGFLNVLVVAVAPRPGAWLVRRWRPALPREIAADRAATFAMAVLCAVLIAGGLAHRPALRQSDTMQATAIREARVFAAHHAPARYLPLHGEDTWQPGPSLFRTCWEGPDPKRDFCVFVRMDEPVPIKRVDTNQTPNATEAGPDNPGRAGR